MGLSSLSYVYSSFDTFSLKGSLKAHESLLPTFLPGVLSLSCSFEGYICHMYIHIYIYILIPISVLQIDQESDMVDGKSNRGKGERQEPSRYVSLVGHGEESGVHSG